MAEAGSPAGKGDFKALLRRRLPQYIAATAACMGGFSLGCGIGWSAPCIELLIADYGYDVFSTNVVASAFPLGAALGLALLPFFINRIGRKGTMMSLVPLFILGWMCIGCALPVSAVVVIGRLITGACGGMFCVAAPMYTAEICEKEIRGTLGAFFQLLLVIGILYAYCCGFTKNIIWITALCSVAPVFCACLMIFMPESPFYHLIKNNEEAAKNSMRFFRGPEVDFGREILEFKELVEQTRLQKVTLSSLLEKRTRGTLALAFGIMFIQQFSGINVIIFYAETIFKETGANIDPSVQMVVIAVVQVIACSISAALMDKLGRKFLMALSFSVMSVCLISLGIFFHLKAINSPATEQISWLPLVSASVYILAFCLGAGPIPWAYMGEIFSPELKGAASSGAAVFNWMLAFVVTVSFSTAVEAVGTAALMFFFGVICILATVFIVLCMVETKGKSLSEIQEALSKKFGGSGPGGN